MTINEAIKVQIQYEQDLMLCLPTDKRVAIELGIEALKRCKAYKAAHIGLHYEPMPGETPEETEASHET